MEIDITDLIKHEGFSPWDMCNSVANLGDDAGTTTWRNSFALATRMAPNPLDTDEKRQAFREFVKDSGGWTEEEISTWDDLHLNALFCQWVAGDIRDGFGDDLPDEISEWPWLEYEEKALAGRISSRICRGDDGRVYFYVGS